MAVKADDIYSNKPIIEDVWGYLNQARLVIADLTYSNPNVFYELGIAHTLGKEVIMIAQYITRVPFDVEHVRYINYVYPSKIKQFESDLERTIKQVLKESTVGIRVTEQRSSRTKEQKPPSPQSARLQNLTSLTNWTRDFTNHNLGIIHDEKWQYYIFDSTDFFNTIHSNVKTEAMRRWSLSGGTAKNYADTVMLTIRNEFKRQVDEEIAKETEIRAHRTREVKERTGLPISIFKRLETQANLPVEKGAFVKAMVQTGKFTEEEANQWIRINFREGRIFESKPGFFRRMDA